MLSILFVGRAVLQKRIMALLRKIDLPTAGNTQAWEETFMNWEGSTRHLVNYPKTKLEEGVIGDTIHRTVTKRRTSHQSTDHELEVRTMVTITFGLLLTVSENCFA